MRRRRRDMEAFQLSFLDVVTCGLGAIILLLVLSKIGEPVVVDAIRADLGAVVARLEAEVAEIRGDVTARTRSLDDARRALASDAAALADLRRALGATRGEVENERQRARAQAIIEGRLATARQEMSAEMQRLLGRTHRRLPSDATIGGVPVDSEYIIFIVDTSGSMRDGAWSLVEKKVAEVLDIYPKVKGIQVMNDMGEYMFSQFAGRWIPDTPARRRAILTRLATWNPFSNSSPVEGITEAIRRFATPNHRISLYVFGDEFSRGSLQPVVEEVDRLNRADVAGNRRVRIHGIGFPTQFARAGIAQATGIRFAALMRVLAERNGGTFVGLNDYRR